MEKLGILIAGVGGAVASTVVAGIELMRRGAAPPIGILSESEYEPRGGAFGAGPRLVRDALQLSSFDQMALGGWDIHPASYEECLEEHAVLSARLRSKLPNSTSYVDIFPGVIRTTEGLFKLRGSVVQPMASWAEAAEAVRADIRAFKAKHGLDRIVVVCLMPTRPAVTKHEGHATIAGFEQLLHSTSDALAPDQIFLYAACMEGCGWANFTPNVAEIPALEALAIERGIPLAGRDGKTGQTFIKTVLAPAFRARRLNVRGWFSTNILGNRDGKALRNPDALKNKIETKASALDSILGYRVGGEDPSHVVTIHYYPPRGDAKEAWDNIDLEGFLGAHMSIKVNFLCRDSILAAPLVIDLARFIALAHRRGERGFQRHLGGFFKYPLFPGKEEVIHDYFQQQRMLAEYVERCLAEESAKA